MTTMSPPVESRRRANEMALLAFMASVTMLFAALTSAYLIRRTGTDWRMVALPRSLWVSTALAVVCTISVEIARRAASARWLWITLGLGAGFLGAQVWAWLQLRSAGVFTVNSPHGSFFYLLSAVHGVHVLGGLVAVLAAILTGRGHRLCANYWHFLTGLWIYVFAILS